MAFETVRVVVTGDTHLGFDLASRAPGRRRRRGEDFFGNYERVLRHVLEVRPSLLVHGGDLFHSDRVPEAVSGRAYEALAQVADAGVTVVIAPGNHERSRLPSSLWLCHRDIHVLDRPRTVTVRAGAVAVAVGGFPFRRGDVAGAFSGELRATGLGRAEAELRLLCMHQAVEGSRVGPSGYEFRRGPQVIPRARLANGLAAVLAGHIHRAQVLAGEGLVPVYYPGSVERTSVAERDEQKGFLDLCFGRVQGKGWSVVETAFLELPARPIADIRLPPGLSPAVWSSCCVTRRFASARTRSCE